MARRPGNNPKRRIAALERLTEDQKNALMGAVRYVGSGHHKRNPVDYGLLRANPRPTEVFEAKTDTHGTGEYHGYPLEDEDAMHKYVKSIWEERWPHAGQ